MENQPLSSVSSGSQAPKKCHLPWTYTSTQAWLSSQWSHQGVYTWRAGMPTLRNAVTAKVDSSPHRPLPQRYTVRGDAVRPSVDW